MEIGGQDPNLAGPYPVNNPTNALNSRGCVGIILPSIYTVATLPPATSYPPGTLALTSDGNWYFVNNGGSAWQQLAVPTGGGLLFNSRAAATVPSGVTDNYSPVGYTAGTTNRLNLTPTDATSTLNGLVAPTVDGFPLFVWNPSTTLYLKLNSQASSIQANRFNLPGNSNSALAPLSGQLFIVDLGNGWDPG